MNTDSRRKASAAHHAKREAAGLKKVTLWLSPEARSKLDGLKAEAGSKDKAADAAILAWRGLGDEKPVPRPKSPPSAIDVVKAARPAKAAGGVDIPLHKPKAFNPQPKTGKTKR